MTYYPYVSTLSVFVYVLCILKFIHVYDIFVGIWLSYTHARPVDGARHLEWGWISNASCNF
jgi:hypothetical protein